MKNLNRATIQFLITFTKKLFSGFLLNDKKWTKYFQPAVRQLLMLLALSLSSNMDAATCRTTAPGVWDCGTPTGADDMIVNHDVTITGNFTITGSLIVNAGATITFTGSKVSFSGASIVTVTNGGTIRINNDLDVKSTLNVNAGGEVNATEIHVTSTGTGTINGTLNVSADFDLDGSICGSGTVYYDTCSGSGDACGETAWCDGSGTLDLGALPVELYTYEVKLEDNKVRIDWSTASEIENDYFVVERSQDAYHFEEIGREEGAGFSESFRYYAITDELPFAGVSYYRLKQVDFDGTATYFDIKMVDNKDGYTDEHGLSVFPNPIMEHSKFSIGLEGFDNNSVQVKIQNMNGFLIYDAEVDIAQERELIELETAIIQDSGMYVASVFNGKKWYNHKFLVVK